MPNFTHENEMEEGRWKREEKKLWFARERRRWVIWLCNCQEAFWVVYGKKIDGS